MADPKLVPPPPPYQPALVEMQGVEDRPVPNLVPLEPDDKDLVPYASPSVNNKIPTNGPLTEEDLKPLNQEALTPSNQPTPTPSEWMKTYNDEAKLAGAYLGYSEHELVRNMAGIKVADGEMKPAEAQMLYGHIAMDRFRKDTVSPLETHANFGVLHGIMQFITSAIPSLKEQAEGTAIGVAEGGSIGAAGGLLFGGPPGALVAGAAGVGLGALSGAADTTYELSKGQLTMDLLDRDVPAEVAIPAAKIGGALVALTTLVGLGSVTGKALAGVISKVGSPLIVKALASKIVGGAVEGGAYGAANSIEESLTKVAAGIVSHKQGVITPQEATQGLFNYIIGGGVVGGGIHAAGGLLEGSLNEARKIKTEVHAEFVKKQIPQEQIADAAQQLMEEHPEMDITTAKERAVKDLINNLQPSKEAPVLQGRVEKSATIKVPKKLLDQQNTLDILRKEQARFDRAVRGGEADITGQERRLARKFSEMEAPDVIEKEETKLLLLKESHKANKKALKATITDIEASERIAHRDTKEYLDKQIDKVHSVLKREKGKGKTGVITNTTRKVLKKYIELIKAPEKAQDILREQLSKNLNEAKEDDSNRVTETDAMPTADEDIVRIVASDTANLDSMTSKQRLTLGIRISRILQTGKDKRIEAAIAKKEEAKKLIEHTITNIQGTKPIDLNDRNLRKPTGALHWFTKTKGQTQYPWDSTIDNIFQDSSDSKAGRALDIQEDLLKAEAAILDEQKNALEEISNHDKTLQGRVQMQINVGAADKYVGGSKKPNFVTHKLSDPDAPYYKDQEGNSVQLRLTDNQAMQWYIDFKRPSMEQGIIEGNKFTYKDPSKNKVELLTGEVSTQELIESNLTDEQKATADRVATYHNDNARFDRLNKFSLKVFGIEIERDANYTGYRGRKGFDNSVGEEGSNQWFYNQLFSGKKALTPTSTIAKVQSKKGYVDVDIFDNLRNTIDANENWINLYEPAQKIRTVFKNKTVRDLIRYKFGDEALGIIDFNYNNIFGTRGLQQVQRVGIIATVRKNEATAFVAGKMNAIKQLSTIFNAMNYVSGPDLGQGMLAVLKDPQGFYRILSKTDLWKTRYSKNGSGILTEAAERRDKLGFKDNPNVAKVTMGLVTFFDKGTTLIGGGAVYKTIYDKTFAATKDADAAHTEAVKIFTDYINRTSSSSTPDQITYFERGGDLNKMYMLFGKSQAQNIAHEDIALRRALSNPTKENWDQYRNVFLGNRAAQAVFVTATCAPGILWAMANGNQGDTEDQTKNMLVDLGTAGILSQYTDFGLIGSAMTSAVKESENNVFGTSAPIFESKDSMTSMTQNGVQVGHFIIKGASEGGLDMDDTFRALDSMARSGMLAIPINKIGGFPYSPIIKGVKAVFDQ